MPTVLCLICHNEFTVKANRVNRGWGKYCSNACKHEGNKTGNYIECFQCGKETYKNLKDQARSKSGRLFCSKSCQATWRNSQLYFGHNHANWKGGESVYRNILKRSGTGQQCSKCADRDQRVLAVHHKDKDRKNNNVSNLIWLCHNCHYLVHHYKDESKGFLTS